MAAQSLWLVKTASAAMPRAWPRPHPAPGCAPVSTREASPALLGQDGLPLRAGGAHEHPGGCPTAWGLEARALKES